MSHQPQPWSGSGYGVAPTPSLSSVVPLPRQPVVETSAEPDPELAFDTTTSRVRVLPQTPAEAFTAAAMSPAPWSADSPAQFQPAPQPPVVLPPTLPASPSAPVEQPENQRDRNQLRGYTGTAADLTAGAFDPTREKAQIGWRKNVRKATGGLVAPKAGRLEIRDREDRALAASQWSRTMTFTVAAPKGAAGKTPTVVGVSGAFGEVRAGGVLAWDNNETLGTLGIRTQPGRYNTTAIDLLERIHLFESGHFSRGEIGGFVRFQESGRFDVLVSDEDPRRMATIGKSEFERLHRVVKTFYSLLAIDTGNNPRAENFLAALPWTDVLVVPLQWTQDSVESAGRLIAQLNEAGYTSLTRRAITVVTKKGGPEADPKQIARWKDWFNQMTSGIYEIPYDRHIAEGGAITYSRLAEPTRQAYLHLAGGIANGFNLLDGSRS